MNQRFPSGPAVSEFGSSGTLNSVISGPAAPATDVSTRASTATPPDQRAADRMPPPRPAFTALLTLVIRPYRNPIRRTTTAPDPVLDHEKWQKPSSNASRTS